MKISMNVPGYVQDAQHEYISLLRRPDVEEIYIMAPYFSDDKIARALIVTANRLRDKLIKKRLPDDIESSHGLNSKDHKKIHLIFPKKQENRLIEEVSRYYAYYLRNNPVVDSFMLKILKNMKCFTQNRWLSYSTTRKAINGTWKESDEGPNAALENSIRDYLNNVMRVVVAKYSEPFPWGQASVKLSPLDKLLMKLSKMLWV